MNDVANNQAINDGANKQTIQQTNKMLIFKKVDVTYLMYRVVVEYGYNLGPLP